MTVSKVAFLAAALLTFAVSTAAADVLFKLIKLDGSSVDVTYQDMDKAGRIDLKTKLVSLEGEHVANGPLMRDLLTYFGATGQSVDMAALDGARIEIPVSDFHTYDAILATDVNGKRLSVRERGPAWLVYPLTDNPELDNPVYEMRSLWQVKTITMK